MLHCSVASKLCARHLTGNGYGFDGPWRHDSQRKSATKEALDICYRWIEGQESTPEYRDAVAALVELHGAGVRDGCRSLWVASIDRVREQEAQRIAYFEQGMELVTRYFLRNPGAGGCEIN